MGLAAGSIGCWRCISLAVHSRDLYPFGLSVPGRPGKQLDLGDQHCIHCVAWWHNCLLLRLPLHLNQKIKLICLCLNALEKEREIISQVPEYAIVASSWVAVKSYYLLFDMLLVTKYLITCSHEAFNSTHAEIQNYLKKIIHNKCIYFNIEGLNTNHKIGAILKRKAPSGANLKRININQQTRYYQVLKKLAKYRLDEYKRTKGIKHLSGKKKNEFVSSEISINEFFYLYRIKSNYRDLEFLSKDIDKHEFVDFYSNYFSLSLNYYNAFKSFINNLSTIRLGEKLI